MYKETRIFLTLILLLVLMGCSQSSPETTPAVVPISSADTTAKLAETSSTIKEPGAVLADSDKDDEDFEEFDDFEEEFTLAPGEEVIDPFEGYNRFMTDFNDLVYLYMLDPVARGYRFVIPEGARRSVNKFFHNLLYPVRVVNNMFQAKFQRSGTETMRFLINTTIGILGFFDPAKEWFGLEPYEEDFGQTLGFWGVGSGPHFVLPFLGPSNLRDTISLYPDWETDPVLSLDPVQVRWGVRIYEELNDTSLHIGEYESFKKGAVDWYLFLRDAYEQNRTKKIKE